MAVRGEAVHAFTVPPDPRRAETMDELAERLRSLKVWAGDPSYESITSRVNSGWAAAGRSASERVGKTTVVDCFRSGRRRLNTDLVIAVVQALYPDGGYVAQWRQALRLVAGKTQAASQIRVQDALPPRLPEFTGRVAELDRLRRARHHAERVGDAVVTFAIEGMAGVGKTQLAIHAGHLLDRDKPFDRVLFVDLRGFHPDPAQPPADPAAVLEGFLRLLGVPSRKIPYDLPGRTTAFRAHLVGVRALVVLDNAADEEQVRPLVPDTPGCLTLITSRRSLSGLHGASHLRLDVFAPDEARRYLSRAVPQIALGHGADAHARIAHRCGHLPLALGLVAGHMSRTSGWTLTDHADRLEERHQQRRLDTGVELALDLSYQHLPTDQQRLLRLTALHPGLDLDAHAAAALAGTHLDTARTRLDRLHRDNLLQRTSRGRYTLHDLVRAYAATRASDDDPPPARRAALTRLFDYYRAASAAAMDVLAPAETHRRPRIPAAGTPVPAFADLDTARAWLEAERPNLVVVAAHTATEGWPAHTMHLSRILYRYLNGGYHTEAASIHGHAQHAAHLVGDLTGQARALTHLAATHLRLGRRGPAAEHIQQALNLFRRAGDPAGQAHALAILGDIEQRLGRYQRATDHHEQALTRYRQAADRTGEAHALTKLGIVEGLLGRYQRSVDRHQQALILFRRVGDRLGEAAALSNLGDVEGKLGRYGPAVDHIQQALTLYRHSGNRDGEAWTLDNLGTVCTRLGRPVEAVEHHQRAVALHHESGERYGEASALNGLGEAVRATGRAGDAVAHHTAAHAVAVEIGDRYQQARAHAGLGHAHRVLANPLAARRHYQHALTLYTELGTAEADHIRRLARQDGSRVASGADATRGR